MLRELRQSRRTIETPPLSEEIFPFLVIEFAAAITGSRLAKDIEQAGNIFSIDPLNKHEERSSALGGIERGDGDRSGIWVTPLLRL